MARRSLLICGILAMLWYMAVNIIVPAQYQDYDIASQTISELSAVEAPTRALWVILVLFYSLLFTAFGWGIWLSAGTSRALKVVGAVVVSDAIFGMFWPPMHQRGVLAAGGGTLTDTLHLAWTFVHLILILLMIAFGASVSGKWFRIFSVGIVLIFIVFGVLTAIESRGLEANLPTPYIGIWERVNIGAYMIWVIVFAIKLLRRDKSVSFRYVVD